MSQKLVTIDSVQGIKDLQEYLADKEYIAYDVETTGLSVSDQIIGISICCEISIAYYLVIWSFNKSEGLFPVLYGKPEVVDLLNSLKTKNLIMHNGVFDCMFTDSNFKIRLIDSLHTDTMILAHLLDENRRVGLKELATTMYGESSVLEAQEMRTSVLANGGSATKKNYEMYKADTQYLAKYGAKDALLTYRLFIDLVPDLFEQGLDKFFYEDESMPLLRGPTYDMNYTGMWVDTGQLVILKKQLEAECIEAKAFIHKEIHTHIKDKYPGTNKKNTFNVGSNVQLSWLLFSKLNLEFESLTNGGKNLCKSMDMKLPYTYAQRKQFLQAFTEPWKYISVDKKVLKKYSGKHEWIAKLLEFQRKKKILTTYIKGIEEGTKYGVIRPGFLQHGTTSGRYSSRKPNFQNLPRDDKRIKDCIVSRPGKSFIGADYSQLEPRVFSFFSGDTRLRSAFSGADDFYSVVGIGVYNKQGCEPKKEGPNAFGTLYPKLRQDAKVFALASTYGATGAQLAPLMGKSIDKAQEDIDKYFETFPKVAKMMIDSHNEAKKNGVVLSHFGRPRRIPEAQNIIKIYGNTAHGELPYKIRSILNLSVNHRIQSTAASIVNRAAIKFWQYYEKSDNYVKIVCQVHDSLIIECDTSEVKNAMLILQNCMENATQLEGIRLEALPKVGKTLAEV